MIFSFGVVSPGLGQNAEAMLAAGCGGGVAEAGEHLQGLPVAAFRLDVIPPGLGDLADLMDPRRAQRPVPRRPHRRRSTASGSVTAFAPGVHSRARALNEGATASA